MIFRCFTAKPDSIEEGITAQYFDSIVLGDPYTKEIKLASLTAVPAMPAAHSSPLFQHVAESSVVFLVPPMEDKKPDKSHIILALSPEDWILSTMLPQVGLVDPSGTNGMIILYVPSGFHHVLTKSKDITKVLSVSDDGKPYIEELHRGNLIMQALRQLPAKPTISKLLPPDGPEDPKNAEERSHSAPKAKGRKRGH